MAPQSPASAATSPVSGVVVTSNGVGSELFTGTAYAAPGAELWVQVLYGLTASHGKLSLSADLTAGSNGAAAFSISVPGLTVSTTYNYQFRVVTGGVFSLSPNATFTTAPAPYWHAAQTPIAGQVLRAVSCPVVGFCETVTETDGNAGEQGAGRFRSASYDGSQWSAPIDIAGPRGGFGLTCLSRTFCFAGDDASLAYRFDGTSWTRYLASADYMSEIGCGSPSFCVVVGQEGEVWSWNGTKWQHGVDVNLPIYTSLGTPIACPSANLCLALLDAYPQSLDATGPWRSVVAYNGSTWTPAGLSESNYTLQELSCASTNLCMVVSTDGKAWKYNGSTWSGPVTIDSATANVVTVSCTPNGCLAGTKSGDVIAFNGTSWGTPVHIAPTITSVSCATLAFCVAVGGSNSWTYSQ